MDPAPASTSGRRWPRSGTDPSDRPLRILVCDDEPAIVRLIQVNLEHQGYELHTAADGREAWEKIRTIQPDIVILDILMPFMDGFEILRRIRKDPASDSIFVILLTTAFTDEDRARGMALGADMYLTKPFEPSEVTRMIDSI